MQGLLFDSKVPPRNVFLGTTTSQVTSLLLNHSSYIIHSYLHFQMFIYSFLCGCYSSICSPCRNYQVHCYLYIFFESYYLLAYPFRKVMLAKIHQNVVFFRFLFLNLYYCVHALHRTRLILTLQCYNAILVNEGKEYTSFVI